MCSFEQNTQKKYTLYKIYFEIISEVKRETKLMHQKRNFSILHDKYKKIFHAIDINNGKCLISFSFPGKRYEIQHFFCD